ncbi:MAG: GNAT family N-acetyltransferase [Acidimicrobiia bacterium]|nr:GNAT family N-acetyltransferase [Acidimicrobiia bacterium]
MQIQIANEIEQAALRAFPALEEEILNGWLLRFANGQSRRINSAQPIVHSGDVASDIAATEAWYAARGIPCTFRLTPMSQPANLDQLLESRGYLRQDPTSVQTLDLTDALFEIDGRIRISDRPSDAWFDTIMGSSRYMAGRRPTLERTLPTIEPPTAFAVLWEDDIPVATGLAVADGDLVGLYSISTRPEQRRRGLGRTMSETLLEWGRRAGASLAYLQVMHINTAASELYRRMGFDPIYDYWYRSPIDRPPMNG